MKNKTFASLAVASALGLLIPLESHAFGLGTLKLQSALNQPFKAEIPLTAVMPSEQDNIQVKLASADEFTKAGLDRSYLLTKLKFDVVYTQGKPRIIITSNEAIREPFLDFLISASAGEGQMIREYTVLLDPPKQVFNTAPTSSAPTQVESTSKQVTEYSATSSNYATPGQYGPTTRSDTLWRIASSTRPQQNLSVNQMMIALLKANPSAFKNSNINGLKAGYTLSIPSVAAISKLSKSQALAAVREQNRLWKNHNQPASTSQSATEADTSAVPVATSRANSNEQAKQTTQPSTVNSTQTASKARLELVSPENQQQLNDDKQAPQGDKKLKQLSEQLTLAQESIEAQKQENIDVKQRMAMMEEQLKTLHRLISLKDADLARLQSVLDKDKKAPVTTVANAASGADDTLSLDQTTNNGQMSLFDDSGNTAQSASNQTTASSATSTEPQQKATTDQTKAVEASSTANMANKAQAVDTGTNGSQVKTTDTVPDQVDEIVDKAADALNLNKDEVHSLLNQVKQFVQKNQLEVGLGTLLILLLLLMVIRRRNRVISWDEAVEDMTAAKGKGSSHVINEQQFDQGNSFDEPEVTEITPTVPEVRVKTVAELIEQADMFVGYADYVQAKSSLEQAQSQEPDNQLVIQKLLFVLYKQKQTEAFVNLAQSADLDQNSDEWDDITTWGRELAPGNPLFAVKSAEVESLDDNVDDETQTLDEPETDQSVGTEAIESVNELTDVLTADNGLESEEISEEEDDTGHIEFDLSDYNSSQTIEDETAESIQKEADAAESDDLLAFDTSDIHEEESELDFNASPKANETADTSEQTEDDNVLDLGTLSFESEPADKDNTLQIDDTDLTAVTDEELEAAANELANEDATVDQFDDADNIELDISDFDEIDEAETKLDLAAAYIDMGDPEGARSILEEVVREGNGEQKARAQTLLQTLSQQ